MFWVLHDLLQTVQNVQYNLTFLSFLLILGHIKSRLMKRHVISYLFDISIISSMRTSLTDEIHLYNLIAMPSNIRSKIPSIAIVPLVSSSMKNVYEMNLVK